jgi:hypothetical protein
MVKFLHCPVSLVSDLKGRWEDRGLPVTERDTVNEVMLRHIMMCFERTLSLARQGGCPLLW